MRALLKRAETLLRSPGATDDEAGRIIELKAESNREVKGRSLADVSAWLRY
jgi:hypothetical protein